MTAVYLDDVIITGRTVKEHDSKLIKVLTILQNAGLRLRREKCEFSKQSLSYLGHIINSEGIRPRKDKIKAIEEAPKPSNVAELRSYLGLLNYYHRFLPKLSSELGPLHRLLQKDVKWEWGRREQHAFQHSKALLQSSDLLVHYDPAKPVRLSCDASPYGIGAVLSHVLPNGEDKPISYASRTLSPSERNYAHIERETVSIIFGVKYFHKYLYGRSFEVVTDHKPLLGLIGEHKGISTTAASRIQRWSLFLGSYMYTLRFRPGSKHCNADAFSRLPITDNSVKDFMPPEVVHTLNVLDDFPITSREIGRYTLKDNILARVINYVRDGWPEEAKEDVMLKPYYDKREELMIERNCIMWHNRIVVPATLREQILRELHDTHSGMVKMKAFARCYLWWPKLDCDIERLVKNCYECQSTSNIPPDGPLQPWRYPDKPWHRIHIDFAGPVENKYLFIIVDAYSKYIDCHIMTTTTVTNTLNKLGITFATHGLPHTIVSDNGPQFTSAEFKQFCMKNGIQHIRTSPYHPSSNGLAERAVQTIKTQLRKTNGDSLQHRISRVLLLQHTTPASSTGRPPCEMLMGRRVRVKFDLLRPSVQNEVYAKQEEMKSNHDARSGRMKIIYVGDKVYALNYGAGDKWVPAVVQTKIGQINFEILLHDGRVWRRHIDQLRIRDDDDSTRSTVVIPRYAPINQSNGSHSTQDQPPGRASTNSGVLAETQSDNPNIVTNEVGFGSTPSVESTLPVPQLATENTPVSSAAGFSSRSPQFVRRSSRVKKPVQRLNL
ncbi:Uncharacterised protein r2_g3383 [Pycnogonum litorale]